MVSEANEPGSEHAARSPRIVRRGRHDYADSLLSAGERARGRASCQSVFVMRLAGPEADLL